ncbi:MAG: biopolymer transporter ExbD [Polyangiales bacterium]
MAMDLGSAGAKRKGRRRRRSAPAMNVTPLVDVVLVLLIIFMVITPLLAKQFWIHMPDKDDPTAEPPPPDDPGPIVVSVTRGGRIRINRDEVADAEFPNRLRRVLAARRTRTIFFDSSDAAEFGRAMAVMDLARAGGASTIAVSTEALPATQRD